MESIISFTDENPTAAHFITSAREILTENGYTELKEEFEIVKLPEKFFICRDEQSLLVFHFNDLDSSKIITSTLDYPSLKVLPNGGRIHNHCEQANVCQYGRGMWITWPDRDLSVAGRVLVKNENGETIQKLVHSEHAIAEIPMLASHLKPGSSLKCEFNSENHFKPVLRFLHENQESISNSNSGSELSQKHSKTLLNFIAQQCDCKVDDIVDFELKFISAENSTIIGVNDDIISSQRISSIMSSYIVFDEFIKSPIPEKGFNVAYFYNNDQEASPSRTSPESDFLDSILKRIGVNDKFYSNSVMLITKHTKSGSYKKRINYYSDMVGNYQSSDSFLVESLQKLEKEKISVSHTDSNKYLLNGGALISKRLHIPMFLFGISIFGMNSIRETIPIELIELFRSAVNALLK
ncbi:hypothetical protein TRFO_22088 [Tritrichomonas foetus]|uniref:aspartyl aminopeptidase n=1 Tax=Tritrichomonas foetus TaxID=1144522 RepID=A0A1J4KIM5_9EUKA|nr:hypothetical protein TRFO_22088 [Tritrichomonas foetus]|eukprot:OHT09165.1 hypothetical protein TRFO_22088 [Tritrichomonas foetus]